MEMDNNSLTFFNATPSQVMTHKTEQQESEDHQSDMGDDPQANYLLEIIKTGAGLAGCRGVLQ